MRNKLIPPYKKLIGHGGVPALRPENTLCSFREAARLGLTWIEYDIQLSKDNKWVVIHDRELVRTTSTTGLVQDYSEVELTTLSAGSWYNPPFPNEMVPTLEETLILANELQLCSYIKINPPVGQSKLYAEQFIDFARTKDNLLKDCILSSFDFNCTQYILKQLPYIEVAYLAEKWDPSLLRTLNEHEIKYLSLNYKHFNNNFLNIIKEHDIRVLLYTINDLLLMKAWSELGVYGIITDYGDLLEKV